jgi:hypothetical protein
MTRIKLYYAPKWLRDGDPNDITFFARRDLPCIGKDHLYFSEAHVDVARCRELCAICPAFEDCARWVLNHYELMEFGTMAGLDQDQRRRIHAGEEHFRDWRGRWSRGEYARMVAQDYYKRQRRRRLARRRDHAD